MRCSYFNDIVSMHTPEDNDTGEKEQFIYLAKCISDLIDKQMKLTLVVNAENFLTF